MGRLSLIAITLGGGLVVGLEIWPEFINVPSLLITVGGTIVVTVLTFSWARVCELGTTLQDLSTYRQQTPETQIADIKRLTHLYNVGGIRGLENQETTIHDPFLKLGVRMVVDLRKEREIQNSLEQELLSFFRRSEAAMEILLTIRKLLPAFGLIGTLIGLVLLLRQIPTLEANALPSAFSLAVLTTLYGALLANVLVLPLVAKLQSFEQEREAIMRLSLEGVVLLVRGESSVNIEQRLRTLFLSPPTEQRPTSVFSHKTPLSLRKPMLSRVER